MVTVIYKLDLLGQEKSNTSEIARTRTYIPAIMEAKKTLAPPNKKKAMLVLEHLQRGPPYGPLLQNLEIW
jgi:hypothetical protein